MCVDLRTLRLLSFHFQQCYEASLDACDRAIELVPKNSDSQKYDLIQKRVTILLALRRYKEGVTECDRELPDKVDHFRISYDILKAHCCYSLGDFAAVFDLCGRHLDSFVKARRFDSFSDVHHLMALSHFQLCLQQESFRHILAERGVEMRGYPFELETPFEFPKDATKNPLQFDMKQMDQIIGRMFLDNFVHSLTYLSSIHSISI